MASGVVTNSRQPVSLREIWALASWCRARFRDWFLRPAAWGPLWYLICERPMVPEKVPEGAKNIRAAIEI